LAELIVGNKHASPQPNLPDEIYVRKPDDQQSWLAEGKLDADTDSSNWMNHDIISIDHAKIAKIDVERGNEKLELVRNGDRFELKVPADHPSLRPLRRAAPTAAGSSPRRGLDRAPASALATNHRAFEMA